MYKTPMFKTRAEAKAYVRTAIMATAMTEEEADITRYDEDAITDAAFSWSKQCEVYIWMPSSDGFQTIKWDHFI